ncbi:hypothetical protein R70723_02560 [Paenibacillus sp. FSL R7-0273]|uniref:alpha/beta hydrolase n=1 Tax=Paenibacillus sp. FSL R7-0273 TaxID=1536772 RepID=UPI0004F60D6E|nr:alpha/beta hydrolase [Paenibacillus sp. FSL R7-0273]AIQ44909.1 hypothetical protein R70723_02560 [Paenibacillus sp. FSL R7-0273]OMF93239.1 hypothetical protein BK144_10995 [Paenibacillus sp. FSL R7-0273]
MSVTSIMMSSHWGREVRHKYAAQGSKALAVIFPGQNYSAERSLLDYAGKAAAEHGCDLLFLEYGYQSARAGFKREELDIVVEECKAAIGAVAEYEQLLFISKSMGTVIAGRVAAELGIQQKTAHLYLTPTADAVPWIRQSRGSVIYGGSDPMFSGQHPAEISGLPNVRVYRIDDANHALEVGSVNESLAVLLVIINFYHEFFRDALDA